MGEWPPDEFVPLAFPPPTGGKTEVMDGAMLDDSQGRAGLGKEGKEEADGLLHFLVGIEDHLASGIEAEPRWRSEPQGAMLGLFQLAAQEPVAQPVQLGFAHGALEAQ